MFFFQFTLVSQQVISCSLGFGHHQYFVTILDAVGVESSRVVLHFLWTEGTALVDVVEPHAVGRQLDHCRELLFQLSHCLVQTDAQLAQRQTISTFATFRVTARAQQVKVRSRL